MPEEQGDCVEGGSPAKAGGRVEDEPCYRCKERLASKQFIKVGPYKFHKDHFTCVVCDKSLHGAKPQFRHKDGGFYCMKDYIEKFCFTCAFCNEKITGTLVPAFGKHYHPEHFRCKACNTQFENGRYFDFENEPYCKTCFEARARKKCSGCGNDILQEDQRIVCVEDKVYHETCLQCSFCHVPFPRDSTIFHRNNNVYCRKHFISFFVPRCTTCGEHITKQVVAVKKEYYHPTCFKCAVCEKDLDKYICKWGYLRCSEHVKEELPELSCHVCQQAFEDENEIVRFAARTIHQKCFVCSMCKEPMEKAQEETKGCRLSEEGELACMFCISKGLKGGEPIKNSSVISGDKVSSKKQTTSGGTGGSGSRMAREAKEASKKEPTKEPVPAKEPIKWRKGNLIAAGANGRVFEAYNTTTGSFLAVKIMRLRSEEDLIQAKQLETEVELLRDLRHPNIVTFYETQRTEKKLHILMEFVAGKSLDHHLKSFGALSEELAIKYTRQLAAALAYCHANNVVHRDIKGKNILVDTTGNIKLADFGSAKKFDSMVDVAASETFQYTPLWTAPEVIGDGQYNSKVDIWSMGCVILEMLTGQQPWAEEQFENPYRALYHIGSSDKIPRIPEKASETAKSFLKCCLVRDVSQRSTAVELLNHSWLN